MRTENALNDPTPTSAIPLQLWHGSNAIGTVTIDLTALDTTSRAHEEGWSKETSHGHNQPTPNPQRTTTSAAR
eukprot:1084066-Rhodomonas_salina.1